MKLDKLNDWSLITQVRVFQRKRAFDKLVLKYQSTVRTFFRMRTMGDNQLSDDLAQETFLKAYTQLDSFKGLSSFSTWLLRIAYNVFYDYTRNKRLTEDADSYTADCHYLTEQPDVGVRSDVYKAMQTLSEAERICVSLRFIDDQKIEKIVEITGLPEGSVKSHLHRGKQKLVEYLKKNGYDK